MAKNASLSAGGNRVFVMRRFFLSLGLIAASAVPGLTHEFWIEPEEYQVASDKPITATLRNGEEFKGVSLAWFERQFTRFDMVQGKDIRAVEGRMGDTPALQSQAWQEGLLIILHERTPSTVVYRDWDKFLRFVEHKDFKTAVDDHEANGWRKDEFRESYTRHAKALVAVGHGQGQDRAFGLATEFVALTNPYDPEFDGNMRVKLLYGNVPRSNAQVEVFEKGPDGSVAISLYRTDTDGIASIPVTPGNAYLFDAVVLRPSPRAGTEERAPVWETLWAALTFAVPE